jgi:hypothetical protein
MTPHVKNEDEHETKKPDVNECPDEDCSYTGEMVCDIFEEEYWIICPRCDELVIEGEVPVSRTR